MSAPDHAPRPSKNCEYWALNDEFVQLARNDAATRRLTSIPGIGVLNATALVAAVVMQATLPRPETLAPGSGWFPRQYSTGGKSRLLGILARQHLSAHFAPARHCHRFQRATRLWVLREPRCELWTGDRRNWSEGAYRFASAQSAESYTVTRGSNLTRSRLIILLNFRTLGLV
ncbi:MAG: hypothetical protein EOS36_30275 [Mesorhizobium sp.]|uniref:transposase n=1 Tax=Mesorhizobium sp. TaxID=1871066 RepID=UPI000FE4F6CE|nr:MAG: hypothetical protein EOS36_30275 [Mesorhizobium sp.]RWE30436.1 MAG: hypothetical protein EOS79_32855 [Mesorhizobium sp.]